MNGRLIACGFVIFWSTGFIVARTVRPYADPFAFVCLRFVLAGVAMAMIAFVARAPWPATWRGWADNLVAGTMIQGAYVGATFWAVKHGLPAAIAALIAGLQPLMTAALAGALARRAGRPAALGWNRGGFCPAHCSCSRRACRGVKNALPLSVIAISLAGTLAMTFGAIWQKRTGGSADLRSGATIQLIGGLLVTVPLMLLTEAGEIHMTAPVVAVLVWSVLGLNICAGLLLLWLLKRGAVAAVTSLFYLCPPVTGGHGLFSFRRQFGSDPIRGHGRRRRGRRSGEPGVGDSFERDADAGGRAVPPSPLRGGPGWGVAAFFTGAVEAGFPSEIEEYSLTSKNTGDPHPCPSPQGGGGSKRPHPGLPVPLCRANTSLTFVTSSSSGTALCALARNSM